MDYDDNDVEHVLEALVYGEECEVHNMIENYPTLIDAPLDEERWTLLHFASGHGQLDIVDLLLNYGASLDKPSIDGEIPLTIAVQQGHDAVVEKLMRAGSNPNKRDKYGSTPLLDAISKGKFSIYEIIMNNNGGSSSNIRESDRHGNSHLMIACWCGYDDIVEDLLDRGVDINAVHINGTALMCAIRRSQKDTVKLLLRRGADPRITRSNGYDALRYAEEEVDHRPRDHRIINMIRQRLQRLSAPNAPSNANNSNRSQEAAPAPSQHVVHPAPPPPPQQQRPQQEEPSTAPSDDTSISNSKCIACMVNNPVMVFPVCGHLYLCEQCAPGVGNRCPGCRVESIPIKVHLP